MIDYLTLFLCTLGHC